MRSATTVLAPDEGVAEGLVILAGEVHRLGGNLNQVAHACNEARVQGQPLADTAESHAQVRAAVDVIWTVVGQVRQMAFGLRGQLDLRVTAALRTEGSGAMSLRSLGPGAELFDEGWSRVRGRGG